LKAGNKDGLLRDGDRKFQPVKAIDSEAAPLTRNVYMRNANKLRLRTVFDPEHMIVFTCQEQ